MWKHVFLDSQLQEMKNTSLRMSCELRAQPKLLKQSNCIFSPLFQIIEKPYQSSKANHLSSNRHLSISEDGVGCIQQWDLLSLRLTSFLWPSVNNTNAWIHFVLYQWFRLFLLVEFQSNVTEPTSLWVEFCLLLVELAVYTLACVWKIVQNNTQGTFAYYAWGQGFQCKHFPDKNKFLRSVARSGTSQICTFVCKTCRKLVTLIKRDENVWES